MTPQKGVDLLGEALDAVMGLGVRLVMLASGDPAQEKFFKAAEQRFPDQLRVQLAFDNDPGPSDPGRERYLPDAVAVRAMRAHPDVRAKIRHRAAGPCDRRP